ncbi:MAG: zinc ribbon domain-containing protein YjdM [Myxococcota bacterium]
MEDEIACPICTLTDLLQSETGFECATCGHEWDQAAEGAALVVHDANGNLLQDGDTVTLIKDLKVKGSGTGLKAGTKVKKIRLVDPDQNAGHEIDAKAAGMGVLIRAKFVKRA